VESVWLRRLLRVTVNAPTLLAWELIIAGLGLSWVIAYGVGGENVAPPHWFYFVVAFSGVRFGWRGALVVGAASGALAGPALPADVAAGVAQGSSEWVTRAVFFVLIGQMVALLVALSRRSLAAEVERLRAERDVLRALDRGEFRLQYQPIVALGSERVIGVEALARWAHPEAGMIEPCEFIALAEGSTAINALGQFVLDETCRQVAVWKQTVLRDATGFKVAVNVSTLQLTDPMFPAQIAAAIDETGIDPSWLYLEVTETALIADLDAALDGISAIKALGARFAIDDFGTGYSSLTYLHRLPVDAVKIDRSFVANIDAPGMSGGIAGLVIHLAGDHGITTVAEGVETVEQADALLELGCECAQGFYFSEPLDAAAMAAYLEAEACRPRSQHARVPALPA
jgi:EAL domain-containing protein (putative c-di-GMP-specific phosphodiesterase class I)